MKKAKLPGLQGDPGGEAQPAGGKEQGPLGLVLQVLGLHPVVVDPGLGRLALPVLEPGNDPLVGHLGIVHHRRLDALEIDGAAVALLGDIALGPLQDVQKGLLQGLAR